MWLVADGLDDVLLSVYSGGTYSKKVPVLFFRRIVQLIRFILAIDIEKVCVFGQKCSNAEPKSDMGAYILYLNILSFN